MNCVRVLFSITGLTISASLCSAQIQFSELSGPTPCVEFPCTDPALPPCANAGTALCVFSSVWKRDFRETLRFSFSEEPCRFSALGRVVQAGSYKLASGTIPFTCEWRDSRFRLGTNCIEATGVLALDVPPLGGQCAFSAESFVGQALEISATSGFFEVRSRRAETVTQSYGVGVAPCEFRWGTGGFTAIARSDLSAVWQVEFVPSSSDPLVELLVSRCWNL